MDDEKKTILKHGYGYYNSGTSNLPFIIEHSCQFAGEYDPHFVFICAINNEEIATFIKYRLNESQRVPPLIPNL